MTSIGVQWAGSRQNINGPSQGGVAVGDEFIRECAGEIDGECDREIDGECAREIEGEWDFLGWEIGDGAGEWVGDRQFVGTIEWNNKIKPTKNGITINLCILYFWNW